MFYLDLDEIDTLAKRLKLMSRNRFNLFNFRDKDHLQLPRERPDGSKNIRQHITDFLLSNGIQIGNGRIMVLTNLCTLGYQFNPVCNTFLEMKPYFLGGDTLKDEQFKLNTEKYFYVSPFIDMDTNFDFNLQIPGEKLQIKIDDYDKTGKRFFISTLTGVKKELKHATLQFTPMASTITLVKKSNFYQDTVLKYLSKMDKGTLYLTLTDGEQITIGNGEGNITANIEVKNDEFYKRIILFGDIGFGEAYVDGLWDTDNITNVIKKGVDWIQKHIFPGSLLPSVGAINNSINRTGDLTMVDLKDIGLDYAKTLKLWFDAFNVNLSKVKSLGFDETFIRKWNYYLCYCEAAFEMRNINVMHLVYTRPNNIGR
eukprot:gene11933-12022_t